MTPWQPTLLAAPPELVPVLDALNTVMARADQNSDDRWRSWDDARADLVFVCHDVLGEPLTAPYDAVDA
jgi:hypothetical protein